MDEERRKEHNESIKNWATRSHDNSARFFTQWALLSAGALTLLVPFVSSRNSELVYKSILFMGEALLIISLLTASLQLLFSAKKFWEFALSLAGETNRYSFYRVLEKWNNRISIVSFVVGIILVTLFVNFNL